MTLLALFLIFCAGHAFAVRFNVTADYKRYDRYRQALIAKGNVTVRGTDFRVQSPYVIIYYADDKIVAMDKFVLEREGYKITGSSMEYYPYQEIGNADHIRVDFGETYLGGRYMTMDGEKFELL